MNKITDRAMNAFVVHAWRSRDCIRLAGRLGDGRSFAIQSPLSESWLWVAAEDAARSAQILDRRSAARPATPEDGWSSFEGSPLAGFRLPPADWDWARGCPLA